MKKTFLKTGFIVLICMLLAAVLACAAFAVPAKPGTGRTDQAASCRSHPGELVTLDRIPVHKKNGAKFAPAIDPASKDLPLLIVVVGFENMPYQNEFDWSSTIFQGDKSLSRYYSDMSFGKFTFTPALETSAFESNGNTNVYDRENDGVIHVSLPIKHEDWSMEYDSESYDKKMMTSMIKALRKALLAADRCFDASVYDVNEDGMISTNELAIGFIVAGYEASETYDYEMGKSLYIWSHQWQFSDAIESYSMNVEMPKIDNIVIDDYISISELLAEDEQSPISVLAHELGHYLGLPDLYDTDYGFGEWGAYDVDVLSLMCGGSWGLDEDFNYSPYSLDVWSRYVLGWAEPAVANASGEYSVRSQNYDPQNETFSCVKIPTDHSNEYYLLENRQFIGWDSGLSMDYNGTGGILLWHIDDTVLEEYLESNCVNNVYHRPGVMPLYLECSNDSVYTLIGEGNNVFSRFVFFDSAFWSNVSDDLGEALQLPLYAAGEQADSLSGRWYSNTTVQFLNESANEMLIRVAVAPHIHQLDKTDEIPAECEEWGRAAYWTCSICGGIFADENGETETDWYSLETEPCGHAYGDWQPYDKTNHYSVCANNEDHVIFEKHKIELQNKQDATPEQDGYSGDKVCTICGDTIQQGHVVSYAQQHAGECRLCHKEHKGFFGGVIAFFHKILYALGVRR